jgi:hypothetical protein
VTGILGFGVGGIMVFVSTILLDEERRKEKIKVNVQSLRTIFGVYCKII